MESLETRDEILKYIGADYESLEDIVSYDDALLEEIEEIMTNCENASVQSDENSKIIMEMRQSLFSDIYDFNNKSFVTRRTCWFACLQDFSTYASKCTTRITK